MTNPLGRITLYLPQRPTNAELRFARALAAHMEMTVLAGRTGDSRADAAVNDVLHVLGAATTHHTENPPIATQVIHTTDSDDEVRRIVREVIDAIGSMPAHRIAVLHTGDVPYARLLHEQLTAAGIAFNGRGTRAIAERSISRGLLGILALPVDLPRAALFRALAEARQETRRLHHPALPVGTCLPGRRHRRRRRLGRPARPVHPDRKGQYRHPTGQRVPTTGPHRQCPTADRNRPGAQGFCRRAPAATRRRRGSDDLGRAERVGAAALTRHLRPGSGSGPAARRGAVRRSRDRPDPAGILGTGRLRHRRRPGAIVRPARAGTGGRTTQGRPVR